MEKNTVCLALEDYHFLLDFKRNIEEEHTIRIYRFDRYKLEYCSNADIRSAQVYSTDQCVKDLQQINNEMMTRINIEIDKRERYEREISKLKSLHDYEINRLKSEQPRVGLFKRLFG